MKIFGNSLRYYRKIKVLPTNIDDKIIDKEVIHNSRERIRRFLNKY